MSAEVQNTSNEAAQVDLRGKKAADLKARGIDPFGNGFEVPNTSADVKAQSRR